MAYLGKTNDRWFFYGAFPETFRLSRHLRRVSTPAERLLWGVLRNNSLAGYKFRRQHPVREYIVDFFCPEKELVIEIDGSIHLNKEVEKSDLNRTAELERMGITVLRFSNDQVNNDLESVKQRIIEALTSPSPPGEGAGG